MYNWFGDTTSKGMLDLGIKASIEINVRPLEKCDQKKCDHPLQLQREIIPDGHRKEVHNSRVTTEKAFSHMETPHCSLQLSIRRRPISDGTLIRQTPLRGDRSFGILVLDKLDI